MGPGRGSEIYAVAKIADFFLPKLEGRWGGGVLFPFTLKSRNVHYQVKLIKFHDRLSSLLNRQCHEVFNFNL